MTDITTKRLERKVRLLALIESEICALEVLMDIEGAKPLYVRRLNQLLRRRERVLKIPSAPLRLVKECPICRTVHVGIFAKCEKCRQKGRMHDIIVLIISLSLLGLMTLLIHFKEVFDEIVKFLRKG